MNVLILGLNYLPETTSIGPYTADLAQYLSQSGHSVRVVTGFPTAPQWKVPKDYEGKMFMREVVNGIPVFRTYLYVPKHPRKTLSRILFDCSFAVSALVGALLGSKPDIVVVVSPPLQLAITGRIISALRGARLFLHLQDLVPDAAIAVGALRPGSAALRLGQWLERRAYRWPSGIGVICEGMRSNLLAKGVPPEKVVMLPNYIDTGTIRPAPRVNGFRSRFGITATEFLVMYSGSIAGKQGLETFVEASGAFDEDPGVRFCLIGEGPYLSELKETAERLSLRRLTFLPLQPRDTLSRQLSAADVLVITQRRTVTDVVFPGKLLYYMASGTVILAAVNPRSETGRFIEENKVGIVVAPEDPGALASAIRWMQSHQDEVRELGRNGRRVVETQFDRSAVLRRFDSYLQGCGSRR